MWVRIPPGARLSDPSSMVATCIRWRSATQPAALPRPRPNTHICSGNISATAISLPGGGSVPMLRIACTASYPSVMDDVEAAMRALLAKSVSAGRSEWLRPRKELFKALAVPAAVARTGPKHLRPIRLESWQQEIVVAEPRVLLRGLIHSDGCRVMNRVTVGRQELWVSPLSLQQRVDRHSANMCGCS